MQGLRHERDGDAGDDDAGWLRDALALARAAAAFASPNPTVGCVLVRDGRVIGRGAHFYDRRDHAEIAALNDAAAAGENVRGATAYVTLEPCSTHGRTGPCADALIAAGVARVVAATVDPNPAVRGRGFERLRAAGVRVDVLDAASELAQRARALNDAFAFSVQHGRPFVTLKAAVSREGLLAPATRGERAPVWLTSEAARADLQRLRHASDALLTGIGTVLADDPELTDRTNEPRRRRLLRCVLDSQLRMPVEAKMLRGGDGDVLMFAGEDASVEKEASLRERGADVVRVRAGDVESVLRVLRERQVRSVMVEAGSRVNAAILDVGLVDRVVLYFSDVVVGEDGVPFAEGRWTADGLMAQLIGVRETTFARADGSGLDRRVYGYLRDPWGV